METLTKTEADLIGTSWTPATLSERRRFRASTRPEAVPADSRAFFQNRAGVLYQVRGARAPTKIFHVIHQKSRQQVKSDVFTGASYLHGHAN